MTIVNRSWSDEDMELIREAFRAKVIRLGKLLRDSGDNDKHSQRIIRQIQGILYRVWWQRHDRITTEYDLPKHYKLFDIPQEILKT